MPDLMPPQDADLLRRVVEGQMPGFTHAARFDMRFDTVVLTTGFSVYVSQSISRQMLDDRGAAPVIEEAKRRSALELVHSLPMHVPLISQQEKERRSQEDELFTLLRREHGERTERIARGYLGRTER